MVKAKTKEFDIALKKQEVSKKHIEYYYKVLYILSYILNEYSRDLTRADIEFLEMPKNAISTLDFLVSSITKIQKGQRLALGLDEEEFEDTSPVINIIEGLCEEQI